MDSSRGFLLDTSVVLHATHANSAVSEAIEAQFRLSASRFRPAICMEELAYQRWEGDRIAEERFSYDPSQLQRSAGDRN